MSCALGQEPLHLVFELLDAGVEFPVLGVDGLAYFPIGEVLLDHHVNDLLHLGRGVLVAVELHPPHDHVEIAGELGPGVVDDALLIADHDSSALGLFVQLDD